MRVLITTPVYPPDLGGPATFVPRIADWLTHRGHHVTVLTFGLPQPCPEDRWTVAAVPRLFLPIRYALFFLRCIVLARRADVVFSCEHPRLFSIIAARLAGRPVVVRVMVDTAWEMAFRLGFTDDEPQGFRKTRQHWVARFLQRLERWELTHADRVIAVSEHLASMALAMGADPERTVVSKNLPQVPGETMAEERASIRRSLGHEDGHFHILVVARLVPWKGLDAILDAVADQDAPWRLTIVGDGPCLAELSERIGASVSLSEAVDLTGALNHRTTLRIMRASDMLILNSRYEGLSHVVLEAMALGLPVAATDIPGNRELISHDESGLLFPPGDVQAIRAAIERLHSSDHHRRRLADGARRRLDDLVAEMPMNQLETVLSAVANPTERS